MAASRFDEIVDTWRGNAGTRPMRIAGLLSGLAVVALAAWLGYSWGLDIQRHRLGERIDRFATLHARLIPAELGRYDMLSYAAQAPVLMEVLAVPDNDRLVKSARSFLHKLAVDSSSASALLADRRGRIVAANDLQYLGADVSFRPYFKNALSGRHDTYLALAVYSRELGYFVSQPLVDEDGKVLGVLVIKRALERDDYFSQVRDERFISYLTDNHGVIVLSDIPEWQFLTSRPLTEAEHVEIREARQFENVELRPLGLRKIERFNEEQSLVSLPTSGDVKDTRRFLLHTEPIPKLGWQLHTLIELADVRSQARLYAFGAGALAVIGLLLGVSLIARERYRRKLLLQVNRDPLTGLYTRHFMRDHVTHLFGAQDRGEIRAVSLVLCDLDRFKAINDTQGHNAGDMVLKQVAAAILDNKRQSDIVVRYGGEEFAIVCAGSNRERACEMAERMRREVEATGFGSGTRRVRVTLSAGVAERHEGEGLDELVERADRLLYEAKDAGRNQVCC